MIMQRGSRAREMNNNVADGDRSREARKKYGSNYFKRPGGIFRGTENAFVIVYANRLGNTGRLLEVARLEWPSSRSARAKVAGKQPGIDRSIRPGS